MEPRDHRAVILYLFKKNLSPAAIKADMDQVLEETAPSYETVKYWHRQFKCGRTSTSSEASPGRPQELNMEHLDALAEEQVRADARISQRHLAGILGVSKTTIQGILTQNLHMRKVCTRWIPKILTAPQLEHRAACARENLALFHQQPEHFMASIVTGDETWVHHFEPLNQQEAKEWTRVGEQPRARARHQQRAGKVLLTIFWDQRGILLNDYLQQGQTVTGQYYAALVARLREAIKQKRRGMLTAGVQLLHDNAPAHTSQVAVAAVQTAGFQVLSHPPYSPDIAPTDYFLFAHLKKHLRGRSFDSNEDVIAAVETYLDSLPTEFFQQGISALPERWQRVIHSNGKYID